MIGWIRSRFTRQKQQPAPDPIVDPAKATLTTGDKVSQPWLKIEAHCHYRLNVLRERNDGDHDERKTAEIRGRIKELKNILSLGADRPVIED